MKNETNEKIEEAIHRIHDYYLNKIMLEYYDEVSDDIINSIDSIILINNHNTLTKRKYIKLVNDIMSENLNILDEIKKISKLTDMFFEISDDLNHYTVDILREMTNNGEYKL